MSDYYPKPKWYVHELFQKHIHIVKFYPSANNFTQALLVMLVTNITSGSRSPHLRGGANHHSAPLPAPLCGTDERKRSSFQQPSARLWSCWRGPLIVTIVCVPDMCPSFSLFCSCHLNQALIQIYISHYGDNDGDYDVLNSTQVFMQNSHSLLLSSFLIFFKLSNFQFFCSRILQSF